jgi:hypothetical protein
MALSSRKVYKANAKINGLSLDECAILANDSEISPYFDFNIQSDPDISALGIYLKDERGDENGTRIIYMLPGHSASNWETEEGNTTENSGTVNSEETNSEKSTETDKEAPAEKTEENTTKSSTGANTENPAPLSVKNTTAATETDKKQDTSPPLETTDTPESGKENNTPAKEPAGGSYDNTTVTNASSRYAKPTAIINVENIYGELPKLNLDSGLPAGFYTIVFDVIASNGAILNSVEKPFYYLAGEKLRIDDIASYLPGISATAGIVPPGEKVMLEVVLEASSEVKPYIIWYNGKEKISEGPAYTGANRIFWIAPNQNGFQNIRTEVFPFNPNRHPFIHGISRSVSLPVSQRHGREGRYADMEIQLNRWYRLWGNLKDTRDPASITAELIKIEGAEAPQVQWLPVSGSYGLAVGARDSYQMPGDLFKQIQVNEGSGEIFFRFAPVNTAADSLLLSALLQNLDPANGSCAVQAALGEQTLVLRVFYKDETYEAQVPLIYDEDGFISAALDFQFFETSVTVSIGVETPETKTIETWEQISFDFAAGGNGTIQFGGGFNTLETTDITSDNITAILTEIATQYPAISPPPPLNTGS